MLVIAMYLTRREEKVLEQAKETLLNLTAYQEVLEASIMINSEYGKIVKERERERMEHIERRKQEQPWMEEYKSMKILSPSQIRLLDEGPHSGGSGEMIGNMMKDYQRLKESGWDAKINKREGFYMGRIIWLREEYPSKSVINLGDQREE